VAYERQVSTFRPDDPAGVFFRTRIMYSCQALLKMPGNCEIFSPASR
jgi:hypothetical protein